MGVYGQAARWASNADPSCVPLRLLRGEGRPFDFVEMLDTRSLPMPGGPDRTADHVAALADPASPAVPWLLVLELQSEHDETKLDTTLLEVATLRATARHGPERQGRYLAIAGLVYLVGGCPASLLDMTLPSGAGTRHETLVWAVALDDAAATVEAVAAGELSWGMLFWVPLMAGAGDATLIERWGEVLALVVPERRRGEVLTIALTFAELSRRVPEWRRGMTDIELTESEVVNDWLRRGNERGTLRERRRMLLDLLDMRFPGQLDPEYRRMVEEQESLPMLQSWFRAAAGPGSTFETVLVALRQ